MHKSNLSQYQDDYQDQSEKHSAPGVFDPAYLLPRLLSRWYWILLGLLIGLGFGVISAKRAVPIYQARATLVVRDYNVTVLGQLDPSEIDLRSKQALQTVRAGVVSAEVFYEVASDPLVRKLKNLHKAKPASWLESIKSSAKPILMEKEAPAAPELSNMIRSWTRARIRKDTRFIDVIITHTNPDVSKLIANRIIHHYVLVRENTRTSGAKNTLDFLIGESERVQNDLQEARRLLESYEPAIRAEKLMLKAEQEISELNIVYGHKHPKIRRAESLLEQSKNGLITQLLGASTNPIDHEYWKDKEVTLEILEDPEKFTKTRRYLSSRKATLDNEIKSQNRLHESLLNRIKTKEVTAEQADAEVIPQDAARLPKAPIGPDKKGMISKAASSGLIAGILIAFIFQFFDNKIHTIADVEKSYGLSILSVIPRYPNDKDFEKALTKDRDMIPDNLKKISRGVLLANWTTDLRYSEAFRVLRASVSLLGNTQQRKITIVTSATPSEGKTSVSTNLAMAYAKQGTKTLLIDFDLRKPAVHKLFGVKRGQQQGISTILSDRKSISESTTAYPEIPNLSIIFAGPKAPNPGELLEPNNIKSLLKDLGEEYEHIIIDSAPLLAVPDTRVLAPFANNILLVVRADSTPRNAIYPALDLLASANKKPDGIVLNDYIEPRLTTKKHSYNYGYEYGAYGSDDDEE